MNVTITQLGGLPIWAVSVLDGTAHDWKAVARIQKRDDGFMVLPVAKEAALRPALDITKLASVGHHTQAAAEAFVRAHFGGLS